MATQFSIGRLFWGSLAAALTISLIAVVPVLLMLRIRCM